jgi:hypothetical protein
LRGGPLLHLGEFPQTPKVYRIKDMCMMIKKGRTESTTPYTRHPHQRSGRSSALPYPLCGCLYDIIKNEDKKKNIKKALKCLIFV